MFHKEHFCHVASTNRGCPQYSIYVYKTTDSVETMLAEGYFNGALLDLHKNDVIIAEIISDVDAEQFDLVFFRVVSRTLEHVSVERTIIDKDILDKFVKKSGDTMTGDLRFSDGDEEFGFIDAAYTVGGNPAIRIVVGGISYMFNDIGEFYTYPEREGFTRTLGTNGWRWENIYVKKINNGADITIPSVKGTITLNEVNFQTPITDTNKGATMKEIEEVQTTSIKFKGYVSTTQPASDAYLLVEGNMWINAATMPSSFPVPASSIRVWDGSAWQTTTESYTPDALDAWSNINNNEGYYWFGAWKVFSTDLSTEYFTLNQTSGLWEIKQSIHLPGTPTVDTPDGTNPQAIVNVDYVNTMGTIDNKITNCVLQIPQDINLELNNGTLTLKAGSKVYVPNGAGVFNEVTVGNDVKTTINNYGTQSNIVVMYSQDKNAIYVQGIQFVFSGATAPSGNEYMTWYDTTNNVIKSTSNSGKTWSITNRSLPIASITSKSNVITSIDQIFNGFGFIGNSIFALPGVVALTPNGRNEDGSLNNTKVIVSNVIVRTFQNTLSQNTALYIENNYISTLKAPGNYNFETNYNMNGQNVLKACHIGTCQLTQGTVSNFMIKNTFRAADYWDFNKLVKKVDNIERILGTMDYPVYWDYADATDHSHAMPGVQLDAETHQWYVYYKSGRVRQGGTYVNQETRNGTSHVIVTFPVEMANIYYEFQPSGVITSNGDYSAFGGVTNDGRSTTQASLFFYDYVGAVTIAENYMSWSVDGMAADGPINVTF